MGMTLRQARRLKEKSQRDMAKALGVSEDTYRSIENCPERATIRQSKIISVALEMSVDDIFFGGESSLTRSGVRQDKLKPPA